MTQSPRDLQIAKILVPTDFSASADEAFLYAMRLAEGFNARVDIVHAWSRAPEPSGAMISEVATQPPPVLNSITEKTSREALERFLEDRKEFSHRIGESMLVEGNPAHVIIDLAKDTGIDLIAMGTRGRTGLSRLMMGSVAEKVVRHVACPVLMVPSEAVEEDGKEKK